MSDPTERYATQEDVHHLGRSIQDQMDRRERERRERGDERHRQNVARMDTILSEVQKTNGKVIALETMHAALKEEFQAIRKRWHDFRDSVQAKLSDSGLGTGENRKLVMRDVTLVAGGCALFYGFAKLMHWIP